jgi:glycosyltransferase involved in cell wall biosynthesis
MPTVHLIYCCGTQIYTPFAIGRELSQRLSQHYDVVVHDPQASYNLAPEPGDILIGHPDWDSNGLFNRSLDLPQWRRRICMAPFTPGDGRQVAHLAPIIPHCDLYLAIMGPYWMRQVPTSPFRHCAPKVVHMDLAINRDHFPAVKRSFNQPGKRRFLYIGNHPWYKNLGYLDAIAARCPDTEFAWIGSQKARFRNLRQLGRHDFAEPDARSLVAQYDFMITVGTADANPTTILEAMAWGLIPVCTPQSGYEGIDGIVNIPLNDPARAVDIIGTLQQVEEQQLLTWQSANWQELDRHYTWDRFAAQVREAIERDDSPAVMPPRLQDRLLLALDSIKSPYSPRNPRNRWRALRKRLKGGRQG